MTTKLKNIDLAAALGCDAGLISRYRRRGMPATSVADAMAWKEVNVRPRVKSPKTNEQAGIFNYDESRARREHWAAQQTEIAARREAGELIDVAEHIAAFANLGATIRAALEGWAAMLAPQLAGRDEPAVRTAIADQVEQVLRELSAQIQREAERAERVHA